MGIPPCPGAGVDLLTCDYASGMVLCRFSVYFPQRRAVGKQNDDKPAGFPQDGPQFTHDMANSGDIIKYSPCGDHAAD
jgi:hypothetical protein